MSERHGLCLQLGKVGGRCFFHSRPGYSIMNTTSPDMRPPCTAAPAYRSAVARCESAIILTCLIAVLMPLGLQPAQGQTVENRARIVIDDFESYGDGELPTRWRAQLDGRLVPLTAAFFDDNEHIQARRESGNGFARAYADGQTVHVNMDNGSDFDWDTSTHSRLAWDWRAVRLPEGSREDRDRLNDSGAGIYIVFSIDGTFIKRPRVIKYVYSASLPVGTVLTYGKLKVIVASSANEGSGSWQHVERDVVRDYRKVFGEDPPRRPLRLRLWSDSDNTGTVAVADFDNITLLED